MKVRPNKNLKYSIGREDPHLWEYFYNPRHSLPQKDYDAFNVIIESDGVTYSKIKSFEILVECNAVDFEIIERGLYVI